MDAVFRFRELTLSGLYNKDILMKKKHNCIFGEYYGS